MNGGTSVTVIGNLTADPVLRHTGNSRGSATAERLPVATFTIASAPRTFDTRTGTWADGEAVFVPARAWRGTAEHAAASLTRGMRVIATGTLQPRSYTTKAGQVRTVVELAIEDIGPSLRHTTAAVTRTGPGPDQDEEHPPDRFSLSPREYGDDEAWFGLAANPAGRITVGPAR